MKINIIGKRNIPFIASMILFVLSVGAIILFGLKPGIDFTSGSLLELSFDGERPSVTDVEQALKPVIGNVVVQPAEEDRMLLRFRTVTEAEHQQVIETMRQTFAPGSVSTSTVATTTQKIIEQRFETIGPSVSSTLRNRAINSVLAVVIGIILYIAYSFRQVSRPIASWKYGVVAVLAMVHDVVITIGVFAVLGKFFNVEIDIAFVVAMLTVFGYSVNDTIVVFDRIRENLIRRGTANFEETVNVAVNQTLARSLNTSLNSLLVLVGLYLFGGESIRNFSLALIIGVALGAYSSIFVASPLVVYWDRWTKRAS